MPVTVVVGGQFGSEGKGKVAHILARDECATAVVRVGGTNSGHTVIGPAGNPIVFRQLPTAALLPNVTCILSAGSYIDPDILFKEIAVAGLTQDRLFIDPNAMIITERERQEERQSSLRQSIGSTLSGTGAAVRRRIDRDSSVRLATHEERLSCFIKPTVPYMRDQLAAGKRILIEGTQGFGLSLLHSTDYPYVTSRDTTAAAFVSEAGLSPLDVDDIVLVLRAFPIRVGGNSGPLPEETDWDTISHLSGSSRSVVEYTSVTNTQRRVGFFHPAVVRQAILANQPNRIVMNHLDHIDSSYLPPNVLSEKIEEFIDGVESLIDKTIDYIGFSPSYLIRRSEVESR